MRVIYRKDEELRKTLFVDRDGTINRDCPYCHRVEDLYIYDDAVDLIRRYEEKEYRIIIVTNQSGIRRGYFSYDEFFRFNGALVDYLRKRGVIVSATYFCPHMPEDNCPCRKPARGLIDEALSDFRIDMGGSIVVGDREDIDGALANNTGLPFILLKH
ncbi:D,D-heptose 1,7-bisphosphate phosphatase [Thermoplasma sp. Kam2015]|uniref:D-glycero-alpha-D-manno-heptose-1,7-bisphosphate 7-phosphatase n=1 Tax=Thermoplasma sp. Kam2015 TaxID=2094122 RepID=UPI000D8D2D59|nr:HAD family hydrolase [Thermoplasma sp. Kam2015]PYB68805.1 D,D-heptose 1,7-bisphosphate phosphatase [Thermoplasma sp. Kam2015]